MRIQSFCIGAGLSFCFMIVAATAQSPAPKIWDIKLGTPISALPLDQFVDPACGTNGGPPARVLASMMNCASPITRSVEGAHLDATPEAAEG